MKIGRIGGADGPTQIYISNGWLSSLGKLLVIVAVLGIAVWLLHRIRKQD